MAVLTVGCLMAQERFVPFPPATWTATDTVTGIPVTVRSSSFALSEREVTQAEYERVTGLNPSTQKGADLPIHNVSWWDAIQYCNLRSAAEKLQPVYDLRTGVRDPAANGYRLPTETEWIRAAGKQPPVAEIFRYAHLGPADTKDSTALVKYVRATTLKPVGSLTGNEYGIFDMFGNVWEWVEDYNDTTGAISSALNPAGPATGVARVVRGGSYVSTTSRWGREYRSSLEPDRRSAYTGFRVARNVSDQPSTGDADWFRPYSLAPSGLERSTGNLSRLTAEDATRDAWVGARVALRKKWSTILGTMSGAKPAPAVRSVATHDQPTYKGELLYLQVEPDYWEKIYVMLPKGVNTSRPLPVVIVPFYDVDTSAALAMGGRRGPSSGLTAYGHLAVQQGMAAIAIRWFGESYGENSSEVVANLKIRHPKATGLGKWVWDAARLLDYMETRPEFDIRRVGMIGHSLGGKMTMYATAMDIRIRAAVSSEPGVGLSFSNYEDFWYLGEKIRVLEPGTDHHELLAMIAPRPFLLIGGDSADSDKSWHYINAAREVYTLHGKPDRIGYINHRKGHSPTPESIHLAMEWLRRFLNE